MRARLSIAVALGLIVVTLGEKRLQSATPSGPTYLKPLTPRNPTSASTGSSTSGSRSLFGSSSLRSLGSMSTLGNRFGRSSSSSRMASDFENTGTLEGNERFLRENRRPGDFVGTDTRDRREFVGAVSGETSGPIRSAITGPLVRSTPVTASANRLPYTGSNTRMYEPRLRVGFTGQNPAANQLSAVLTHQLQASHELHATSPIEVSVEAGTATLRGAVASEHEKHLAALIASFEPGISRVDNQLRVTQPGAAVPAASPSDSPGAQPR